MSDAPAVRRRRATAGEAPVSAEYVDEDGRRELGVGGAHRRRSAGP